MKQDKKKMDNLDKWLLLSVISVIIYTIAHTIILAVTGAESTVLTICFYGFFAEEIGLCCFLKKNKMQDVFKIVKKSHNNDSDEV